MTALVGECGLSPATIERRYEGVTAERVRGALAWAVAHPEVLARQRRLRAAASAALAARDDVMTI